MPTISLRYKAENAWEAFASSSPCQTVKIVAQKLREVIFKILDFILPKNPVTKRREFRFVPRFVENALGASLFESACPQAKICSDKALVARVEIVFKRVVTQCDRKDLKYEIRVMQDDTTVNAFCAPGGKVVITTAMLKALQTPLTAEMSHLTLDDKIAAVLGHEITHAAAGHGARRMQVGLLIALVGRIGSFILPRLLIKRQQNESEIGHEVKVRALELVLDIGWRVGSLFFMQQRSRCHEYEADKYGIKYAAKAGFNPEGALWIQSLFMSLQGKEKPEPSFFKFLKTHPTSDKRFEANKKTIERIKMVGVERAFA